MCTPATYDEDAIYAYDLSDVYDEDEVEFPRGSEDLEAFGPFKGKGAQREAILAAPGKFPPVVLVDRKDFYSFPSLSSRDAFLESPAFAGREIIERIHGSIPFRPVLDIDSSVEFSEETIEAFHIAFTESALSLGVPDDRAAPMELRAIRPGKSSIHLIGDSWQVPNGPQGKAFADSVRACLPDELKPFIDVSASGCATSSGMRLPGAPKLGQGPESQLVSGFPSPITSWCLQGWEHPVYGDLTTPAVKSVAQDHPVPEEVLSKIKLEFPEYRLDQRTSPGNAASFSRVRPSHCSSCDRTHEGSGAYLRFSGGSFWLNCRRAAAGTPPLLVHHHVWENSEIPEMDEYDTVIPAPGVTVFNEEFNSNFIDPSKLHGDITLRAPWMTGKSFLGGEIIARVRKDPRATVLIVSNRKTLSTSIAKTWGARDYRDIKGVFSDDSAIKYPVSVWQVESLKRIETTEPFTLVVIDEPTALFEHVYQPGANRTAREGISKLKTILAEAGQVFAADNDLSTGTVNAIRAIRGDRPSHTFVNEYQSWAGVTSGVFEGNLSKDVVRRKLFAFLKEQKEKKEAGQPWTGAVAPCHSRKLADGIAREARKLCGNGAVKLYTSESDDAEKEADFKDPAEAWKDMSLVIYTGTVTVGVDAHTDHISNVFAFFTSGNAGAQQSAQMMFRCRKIKEIIVSYYGKRAYGDIPVTENKLFEWATMARNNWSIPDGFRGDRNPVISKPTQKDKKALKEVVMNSLEGRAWAGSQLERHRSSKWFVQRLIRSMRNAGIAVAHVDLRGKTLKDVALHMDVTVAALKLAKRTGKENDLEAFDERAELAAESFPAANAAIRARRDRDQDDDNLKPKTAAQRQGERVFFAMEKFVNHGGLAAKDLLDLTKVQLTEWVKKYPEHNLPAKYEKLARIIDGTYKSRRPPTLGDAVQTTTDTEAESSALVVQVFSAMGAYEKLMNGGTISITPAKILGASAVQTAKLINQYSNRLFDEAHGNRRNKVLLKHPKPMTVLSTMNVALESIAGKLVPKYRNANQKHEGKPFAYEVEWTWGNEHPGQPRLPSPPPKGMGFPPRAPLNNGELRNLIEGLDLNK